MEKIMAITQVSAVKASDGSEYSSVPPNVKGSGAGGNGGAATRSGSSSTLVDDVAVTRSDEGVFGSTVVPGLASDKALAGGVFAGNNEEFIGKRITDVLAGSVNNDVLLSGAAVPENVRSIHKLETLRTQKTTTAIRNNRYNRYTGAWNAGTPVNQVDTLPTDNAANPSRSTPGRLTYKTARPIAVNDVYKQKNS